MNLQVSLQYNAFTTNGITHRHFARIEDWKMMDEEKRSFHLILNSPHALEFMYDEPDMVVQRDTGGWKRCRGSPNAGL